MGPNAHASSLWSQLHGLVRVSSNSRVGVTTRQYGRHRHGVSMVKIRGTVASMVVPAFAFPTVIEIVTTSPGEA